MANLRGWLTPRWVLAAVAVLVALRAGWWLSAYTRGRAAAWLDRAAGHRAVKLLGFV